MENEIVEFAIDFAISLVRFRLIGVPHLFAVNKRVAHREYIKYYCFMILRL